MSTSIVLVVSLKDTDLNVFRKTKGDLEKLLKNDTVKVQSLKGVKDLFKKLNKYEDKLKKTLETTKVVVVFTSPSLASITDESGLVKALKELPELDESSAKLLGKHMEAQRNGGNLLLISLEDQLQMSDFFSNTTHLSGLATGNSTSIKEWICGKCR